MTLVTSLDHKFGRGSYVVGNAWHLVRPNVLLVQGMVGVALCEEMLEEAHVLKAEEGNLVMRLRDVSCRDLPYIAFSEGIPDA